MRRRSFLRLSALTPFLMPDDRARFGFAPDGSAFLLDGEPFQIRSGEMHPARIPRPHWRHRVRMAKAMGMNTIALYVMWNFVEEKEGVFDFTTDRRDVAAFIRLCQSEGMWVLLRPGPYVCGEWDLGGLPAYLLRHKDIKLRTKDDQRFMAAVSRYFAALAGIVRPLMIGNGGPILMVQIENEYASYGSDRGYLEELRRLWLDNGVTGPFYTEDGIWQLQADPAIALDGCAIALSAGETGFIDQAREMYPKVPVMAGEVYPGWLTHWGDEDFSGRDFDISRQLREFMARGQSFNIYMLHGGTNFGFWAGANADDWSGSYTPDITTYDYCAPIGEQGTATPRYHAYREIIGNALTAPLPAVPAPIPTVTSKPVTPIAFASLWDNLPAPIASEHPQPMETHGQNSGYIVYRKRIPGYTGGSLDIRWVHDYATVFVDGHYQGGFSRTWISPSVAAELNVTNDNLPLDLPAVAAAPAVLDIAVEGLGRTNFGQALVDRKGILETVTLGDQLTGWETFPVPMKDDWVRGLRHRVTDPKRPGLFFRAEIDLTTVGDTYVDVSKWTKGVVWVNGNNLGRYWKIGPQHRLYCPAQWLRRGGNEVVLFDLHQTTPAPISFEAQLS
ncbi:beta-galactosidase [Lentzea sp. NPDC006480]|uniref:beta-galactosidase n=1 Tax=Lentzea sp. NPDC006480 TaxID=3157176 RepID=UPI00339FCFFF